MMVVAASAGAQNAQPIALTWIAPPECPAHDEVLLEITPSLRGSSTSGTQVSARAQVTRDDRGGWHADLDVTAGAAHSARTLDADSCNAIAQATALIIALVLTRQTPTESIAPARPTPGPAPSLLPEVPASRARWQLAMAASAALDVGTLPAPAPGLEVAGGTVMTKARARLRLLLGATLLAAQTSSMATAEGSAGGRFAMLGAWGRVCGALVGGRFDLGPCFGAEMDRVSAVGTGAAIPVAGARTWGAACASVLGAWTVMRGFTLAIRVDGVLPFARPTFVLQGSGGGDVVVHRPAPIAVRSALGLEVNFF